MGYLKQIGIEVDLQPVTDAKMNDYWGAGNFDAYIWYWSGDPDPNYQLFVFTSDQCGSWSDGCWKDPKFDALYEEQRSVFDRDASAKQSCSRRSARLRADPGRGAGLSRMAPGLPERPLHRVGAGPGRERLPAAGLQLRLADRAATGRRRRSQVARRSVSVPGWLWLVAIAAIVVVVRSSSCAAAVAASSKRPEA